MLIYAEILHACQADDKLYANCLVMSCLRCAEIRSCKRWWKFMYMWMLCTHCTPNMTACTLIILDGNTISLTARTCSQLPLYWISSPACTGCLAGQHECCCQVCTLTNKYACVSIMSQHNMLRCPYLTTCDVMVCCVTVYSNMFGFLMLCRVGLLLSLSHWHPPLPLLPQDADLPGSTPLRLCSGGPASL